MVSRRSEPLGEMDDLTAVPDVRDLVKDLPRPSDRELSELLSPAANLPRPELQRRLVEGNLWLVLEAAEARQSDAVPVEDLFQEGSTALVTVVHGLDPVQPLSGPEFRSRVRRAVDQVMESLVAGERDARAEDQRWAADAGRLLAAQAEMRLESETEPTDLELAAHLGWPVDRVAQLHRAVDEARSQEDSELLEVLGELEEG
ncbi:MAG: sigma-70 domain-containing protein [Candidatus Dormibacteria bacterium]